MVCTLIPFSPLKPLIPLAQGVMLHDVLTRIAYTVVDDEKRKIPDRRTVESVDYGHAISACHRGIDAP